MFQKIKIHLISCIALIVVSLRLKFISLKDTLDIPKIKLPFHNYLFQCNKENLINSLNWFYKKKFFSCLTCSIILRKSLFKHSDITLYIGVHKQDKNLLSHAWIEQSGNIIFGKLENIDKYKIIHKL